MEASERFFQNRACPYFPCHRGIEEKDFNCLFCYCPLYMLGRGCGGDWCFNAKGYKSCADCTFPHRPENYDRVLSRCRDIMAVIARADGSEGKALTAGMNSEEKHDCDYPGRQEKVQDCDRHGEQE